MPGDGSHDHGSHDHDSHDQRNALILAIKKQQAAATAWLEEAFFRDRGVED